MSESYHTNQSSVTRVCPRCQLEKPVFLFSKSSRTKSGYQVYCKTCIALRRKDALPIVQLPLLKFTKVCTCCHIDKPLEAFHNCKTVFDGKEAACKKCDRDRRAVYRRNNPDKAKLRHRKNKLQQCYGLTWEQYIIMLEAQGGVCAICGKPEKAKNQYGVKRLSVDHNHTTGKNRGLLCQACNMRIGVLENEEFILAGKAYLERYK